MPHLGIAVISAIAAWIAYEMRQAPVLDEGPTAPADGLGYPAHNAAELTARPSSF